MADVDALIVDLDGVIRHWDQQDFASMVHSFGVEVPDFAGVAFEQELLRSAMVGAITYEEWADEIGRVLGERHGCAPAEVSAAFQALRWSVDDDVVALLREVRAADRAKLALFSNASTKLEEDLASVELHVEFDVVFNSARIGMAKPDPAAFIHVAGELGVAVDRCLFVDDTVPNVEGAREAGMQAAHFTGVEALRLLLDGAGLLGDPAP